jgi:hypothetical protein
VRSSSKQRAACRKRLAKGPAFDSGATMPRGRVGRARQKVPIGAEAQRQTGKQMTKDCNWLNSGLEDRRLPGRPPRTAGFRRDDRDQQGQQSTHSGSSWRRPDAPEAVARSLFNAHGGHRRPPACKAAHRLTAAQFTKHAQEEFRIGSACDSHTAIATRQASWRRNSKRRPPPTIGASRQKLTRSAPFN